MNWFTELFIDEAKAALLSRGGQSGSGEDLPRAEETGF